VLLSVVTSFIVIALTYFQLAAEDHRWWWRSFLSGGCVGLFYYFNHSGMNGFLQVRRGSREGRRPGREVEKC
jgi:hypothetical protein